MHFLSQTIIVSIYFDAFFYKNKMIITPRRLLLSLGAFCSFLVAITFIGLVLFILFARLPSDNAIFGSDLIKDLLMDDGDLGPDQLTREWRKHKNLVDSQNSNQRRSWNAQLNPYAIGLFSSYI